MNAPEAVLQVLKSAQGPLTHHDLLDLVGALYEPLSGAQLRQVRRGMLDAGRIVEQGSFSELLAHAGPFAAMARKQGIAREVV